MIKQFLRINSQKIVIFILIIIILGTPTLLSDSDYISFFTGITQIILFLPLALVALLSVIVPFFEYADQNTTFLILSIFLAVLMEIIYLWLLSSLIYFFFAKIKNKFFK